MTTLNRQHRRGQTLLMTTFGLIALLGMLSLVIDLGWLFFTKKWAQGAADAAALAAVERALSIIGSEEPECGSNVTCQGITPCPSTIALPPVNNLMMGCLYAQQNGFTNGGSQGVSIAAGTTTPPPTAPGVNNVVYWVTVRATQSSPSLFSSVIVGDSTHRASSRATAVITDGALGGTLILLNREHDVSPLGPGVNLANAGNPDIRAPGGILMASTKHGEDTYYAGNLQGNPVITAPNTYIRGAGNVYLGGDAVWTATPQNGFSDGPYFTDPMAGKGQPAPLPAGGLANHIPVANGCLDCLPQPLRPGQYYATDSRNRPTGGMLSTSRNVTFADAANGTGFANYVFYGGMYIGHPGSTVTFAPGRYVFAGTAPGRDVFNFANGVTITDGQPIGQPAGNAGEIFIFTNASYPGLAGNIPPAISGMQSSFVFGPADLQAGNNSESVINLHGLNGNYQVPAELKKFGPVVMWQDQRNSRVTYDANGNIYLGCPGTHDINHPCTNADMANSATPELKLQAHPNTSLYGLIYQPRGAWLTLQGSGSINTPLVFITGALNAQGGANLLMLNSKDVLSRKIVALVE